MTVRADSGPPRSDRPGTALIVAARLAGTDGVTLESDKVADGLRRRGFRVVEAAGELDRPGHEVEGARLDDPTALALGARLFPGGADPTPDPTSTVAHDAGPDAGADARTAATPDAGSGPPPDPDLPHDLLAAADAVRARLEEVVREVRPDLLVVQNAWAIPMQLPLAVALARLARATGLPTISHEHDYPWERARFAHPRDPELLRATFPPDLPNVGHLCIHAGARDELKRRRGLDARVLPNVMDFAAPFAVRDDVNAGLRRELGIPVDARLFLQPTRVVPRKGIEDAIELVRRLRDTRAVLAISHAAGDEGTEYLRFLEDRARENGVPLLHVADRIGPRRGHGPDGPVYALSDLYAHADFVTYPSRIEGFGNALLETIAARKPALVRRYPVYVRDIAPTGVRFVEIEQGVSDAAVAAVRARLDDPRLVAEETDHNHRVARARFGLDALDAVLDATLRDLEVAA